MSSEIMYTLIMLYYKTIQGYNFTGAQFGWLKNATFIYFTKNNSLLSIIYKSVYVMKMYLAWFLGNIMRQLIFKLIESKIRDFLKYLYFIWLLVRFLYLHLDIGKAICLFMCYNKTGYDLIKTIWTIILMSSIIYRNFRSDINITKQVRICGKWWMAVFEA